MCASGCFCKEGYIRESNKTGSPCMKQEECNKPEPMRQCEENEEFLECGSSCPQTCDQFSHPLNKRNTRCFMICKRGCSCKQGFYRSKSGRCVKAEECCGNNEVFTDCGTACVESCTHKPQICTEQCVLGCFCRLDYVRASNTTNSPCVPRNKCPT